MDFLHHVEAIVILDNEGKRIFSKYYPDPVIQGPAATAASATPSATTAAPPATRKRGLESRESQQAFEKLVHQKIADIKVPSADGDVFLHDGHTVVFRCDPEVVCIVVGGADENEVVLYGLLSGLTELLQTLLKCHAAIEKRSLLENYDTLLLAVDELVDDGVILETMASNVVGDVQPFVVENTGDGARKALQSINKYIKQNL